MRFGTQVLFLSAIALACVAAQAAAPRFNDTGAVLCADDSGAMSPACAGTGQDGAYGRDAKRPDPKNGAAGFKFLRICGNGEPAGTGACPAMPPGGSGPNQWACTYDAVTGLLWEGKTSDGGLHDKTLQFLNTGFHRDPYFDTSDLATASSAAALCGRSDWRVPTSIELGSLVHYGEAAAPTIDTRFFPDMPAGDLLFWSSSVARDDTTKRLIGFAGPDASGHPSAVWAPARVVSGPPLAPAQRFTTSPDGREVSDALTGLVWRKCAVGQKPVNGVCQGEYVSADWHTALQIAQAAGNGWRLPNIKELQSLEQPGNVCFGFMDAPPWQPLWSNTPHASGTGAGGGAWAHGGAMCSSRVVADVGNEQHIRLVRNPR